MACLDDSIAAAQQIGMRFCATRGGMSEGQGQRQCGLPPDRVVEREVLILIDTQRLIGQPHDPSHGAMVNVANPPC